MTGQSISIHSQITNWQRWLLLAYAVFFAGVAPFICWGMMEDPSHGHLATHFVFQEIAMKTGMGSDSDHGHDICQHDPVLRQNRLNPTAFPDRELPLAESRSTPTMTFISLLMLILASRVLFTTTWLREGVFFFLLQPVKDVIQLVPLPPPRRLLLA